LIKITPVMEGIRSEPLTTAPLFTDSCWVPLVPTSKELKGM
jgi:hypothetical protein